MPRPIHIPKYSLHKPSGQARVLLDGKHVYLGRHGSPESREQYLRLLAERQSGGPAVPPQPGSHFPDLSVNELMVRYLEFAQQYYVKDGLASGEVSNLRDALRAVRSLYSHASASDFGPKALKAVRDHMISVEKLSRNVINARINRVRRMFKWAVSEELVPPSVHEGLRAVAGLRRGRCDAREMEPVHPVDDATVNATLPYLPPPIADMIMLQRYTSMRPGDVVIMRPCDIDTSQPVWVYEPVTHKTQYRGHRRLIRVMKPTPVAEWSAASAGGITYDAQPFGARFLEVSGSAPQLRSFARAVRTGEPVRCSLQDAIDTAELVDQVRLV